MDIFTILLIIAIAITVAGVLLLLIDLFRERAAKTELIAPTHVFHTNGFPPAPGIAETPAAKHTGANAEAAISAEAPVFTPLTMTRREIADALRAKGDPDIKIVERPDQPQLPMSLKYKTKTFAMLHGTDSGVLMIVRIWDDYARQLLAVHPKLRRAHFPRGRNWYYVPIDGTFQNKEAVYRVLSNAETFVKSNRKFSK